MAVASIWPLELRMTVPEAASQSAAWSKVQDALGCNELRAKESQRRATTGRGSNGRRSTQASEFVDAKRRGYEHSESDERWFPLALVVQAHRLAVRPKMTPFPESVLSVPDAQPVVGR